jgi:hypothetical protein
LIGSALAGEPFLETLWFRAAGRTFIASAKIGSTASGAARRALSRVVSSLRGRPAVSGSVIRCPPSPLRANPSRAMAGGSMIVSSRPFACAGSYPAGHRYLLTLGQVGRAAPIGLGVLPVARDGAFSAVVRIPRSASPGESYVLVRGSAFDQCTDDVSSTASCAGYDARIQVLPHS